MIKERGVIQVKGKGEMLTSYVLGRKISRSWHFGRTVSSGNNSLAEVVYGMVRARKRRTGRRGRIGNAMQIIPDNDTLAIGDWQKCTINKFVILHI